MADAPSPRSHSLLARFVRGCFTVVVAVWIFLEEWIWDSLTAFMAWLGRRRPVRWVEAKVARLNPYAAMAVFLVPVLLLLPAKLLGLWLIGSGRLKSGVLVFVVAKVVGTAIAARIFSLTRRALLTIGWFRSLYTWFTALRDRLYAYVKALRAYQAAKAMLARVKAKVRGWFARVHGRGA